MSTNNCRQLIRTFAVLTLPWMIGPAVSGDAQLAMVYPNMVAVSQESVVGSSAPYFSTDEILAYQAIEPNREGLQFFLESIHPDHPEQLRRLDEARQWIEQLADNRFEVRQQARLQLQMMPRLPESELVSAAASGNPEVAASTKAILQHARSRPAHESLTGVTRAVCDKISEMQFTGLTNQLLAAIPLFDDSGTVQKLQNALQATARPADARQLREAINHSNHEVRIAAVRALASSVGADARDDLLQLARDTDERLRMVSARELANLGATESIPLLLRLMRSHDLDTRLDASRVLRAATGQRFDFFAFEGVRERKAAIERWESWIASQKEEVSIQFPLVDSDVELGLILVSDYSLNRVVEFDRAGNQTWEVEVPHPWAIQGLPNGHRLIASYEPSEIIEFDTDGKEIMRIGPVPGNVMGIDRVPNGHTLAACSGANQIVEYDREGEPVWDASIEGRPVGVSLLDDGNLLVTLMNANKVVELDREGEVIWELETEAKPLHAQRFANGNTLVSTNSSKSAIEYDHSGAVVDRIDLESNRCTAARRMSDGGIVVATETSVRLVAPDGHTLWKIDDMAYCYGVYPY